MTMAHHRSLSAPDDIPVHADDAIVEPIEYPFEKLDTTLTRSDLRETAYELFFMACRASAASSIGGRGGNLSYYPVIGLSDANGNGGGDTAGSPRGGTGLTLANSRIKKVLGVKRRSVQMRTVSQSSSTTASGGGGGSSGPNSPGKVRRPMTSAEIMRLQMRVTDQSDSRLRKTLVRTLVGQTGRRAETIILPLELLRQVRPSEFIDAQEYHQWQIRQLKVLEAGLLLHPTLHLDKANAAATKLRELLNASEIKPIDTSKNSESMQTLCESVLALAVRAANGSSSDVCHWADGYPINVLLYVSLLQSIFDLKDGTVVLDEVDELVELMKKTWSSLGINRMIHHVCFSWVLFQRYVETAQVEPELLCATTAMLVEVASDAKRPDRDLYYLKTLSSVVIRMQGWADKMLLDYHESFENDTANMDSIIALGLATWKIVVEDLQNSNMNFSEGESTVMDSNSEGRVSYYIRSSVRNALTKLLENGSSDEDSKTSEATEDPSELLVKLAKDAELLSIIEREKFSAIVRRWHPNPTAIAAITIHNCFGLLLKQYLAKVTTLTPELVKVLQAAGRLEKVLLQMIVDDTADCEDGGNSIMSEIVIYDVEAIVINLLKAWIDERLRIAKECLVRAKETESWMPKSKGEPYAQSVVDLMRLTKVTVEEFFDIPVGAKDDMVQDLAKGLENIIQEYITFVAACGTKQSYLPALPPLTRCNQNSKFVKLWKKAAAPCNAGANPSIVNSAASLDLTRPTTSRGTQRLYIRLNTLHYILTHLNALDKTLSFFSSNSGHFSTVDCRLGPSQHFSAARSTVNSAIHHVAEVAAFRLIFLDSQALFYDGSLYVNRVADNGIRHVLVNLKQNLNLLVSLLVDKAQPLAVKEVMKASFEAFLMVLLAGGRDRAFLKSDHEIVAEDFKLLKRAFCATGEGLVAEETVEREAEVVEGILQLMGLPTEQLIEDFNIVAYEASGGVDGGAVMTVPMSIPATNGKWNRAEPNTVLRVLCYRDDEAASQFLKRNFQLPRRR